MEGDLPDTGQDVVEANIDEGALSIDGHHGCVRRQLEVLHLHR